MVRMKVVVELSYTHPVLQQELRFAAALDAQDVKALQIENVAHALMNQGLHFLPRIASMAEGD